MSKQKKIVITYIAVVVFVFAAIVGVRFLRQWQAAQEAEEVSERTQSDRYITYEGKKYKYNYNLRNILFLGVDKADEFTEQEAGRGGQSDTLILLSMNKEDKTTTLLEISRDTMTDIRVYDINGKYLAKERAQITLQYAYGDGKNKSCRMTKETVEELLYGIPINSYIALGVDGIAVVTDLMGGVRITVPEDYTYIDPEFQKDAELVLRGEQAERYVRYRDTNESGSNNQRMERQTQFLQALAKQLQGKDLSWYQSVIAGAESYITTNVSMSEIEKLMQYTMKEQVAVVPGKIRQGKQHDEFIADNKKLQEMIVKMFYKPVD